MLSALIQCWLLVQALWVVPNPQPQQQPPAAKAEFARDIQPVLEQRCQPCHFPGGVMYAKLPFDRAETIDRLGTRLFSRIKDKKEQELIRTFLERRRLGG